MKTPRKSTLMFIQYTDDSFFFLRNVTDIVVHQRSNKTCYLTYSYTKQIKMDGLTEEHQVHAELDAKHVAYINIETPDFGPVFNVFFKAGKICEETKRMTSDKDFVGYSLQDDSQYLTMRVDLCTVPSLLGATDIIA